MTRRQVMVVAAAREIHDREVVFVGMRLPLLGFALAKATHAANAIGLFENGVIRDRPPDGFLYTMGDPPNIVNAVACLGLLSIGASAYDVQRGDTLWSISQRTGVSVDRLARDNGIRDPNRIRVGQHLAVNTPKPAGRSPESVKGAAARALLVSAARERGVNPSFVLAVSLWESGYNQTMISSTGAVGMMQIEPYTAAWAGPSLMGRQVDIYVARDNARLGAALLRLYLDHFNDPKLALAAYYQGEAATKKYGVYPSSRNYVNGIWALRNQLQAQG